MFLGRCSWLGSLACYAHANNPPKLELFAAQQYLCPFAPYLEVNDCRVGVAETEWDLIRDRYVRVVWFLLDPSPALYWSIIEDGAGALNPSSHLECSQLRNQVSRARTHPLKRTNEHWTWTMTITSMPLSQLTNVRSNYWFQWDMIFLVHGFFIESNLFACWHRTLPTKITMQMLSWNSARRSNPPDTTSQKSKTSPFLNITFIRARNDMRSSSKTILVGSGRRRRSPMGFLDLWKCLRFLQVSPTFSKHG